MADGAKAICLKADGPQGRIWPNGMGVRHQGPRGRPGGPVEFDQIVDCSHLYNQYIVYIESVLISIVMRSINRYAVGQK